MMRNPEKNPNRIVSEYQIKRNSNKLKSIVLVEGSGDEEVFKKTFGVKDCRIINCNGKENVKDSIRMLNNRNQKGVLGIIDTDYDEVLGKKSLMSNIFYTDTHDVETMIMSSFKYFNQFINMYSDFDKCEEFLSQTEISIEESIFIAAKTIGKLRLVSIENNYDLTFKGIDYNIFLDHCLTIDVDKLCGHVIKHSQAYLDIETLVSKMNDIDEKRYNSFNPYDICCGHDITGILQYGLKNIFGSEKGRLLTQSKLEENLRILYDLDKFYETKLYNDLTLWEHGNKPFILFEKTPEHA